MAFVKNLFDKNFIEYASYVIRDRAIPDVEDGLKPVQRRILQTLFTTDDGRMQKVSAVVGECMKIHPHGDASIYGALVTLANKGVLSGGSIKGTFIEGEGNFGNVFTGDSASAPRYIECRIHPLAKEFLYNPNITSYVPSYDGRKEEPVAFRAKVPVALMIGAEGIAVGMSTKILTHNILELLTAQIKALKNESFTLYPDVVTGGLIDVSNYNDGNGKIISRAMLDTSDDKKLIITELPLDCTSESLVNSIEAACKSGKIKINSIQDLSTDHVHIELHLPRGTISSDIAKALYAYTDCEKSVTCQMLVIKDNMPTLMTTTQIINYYAENLKKILHDELCYEKDTLLDELHARTLERIFIEERIYKSIELQKTQAAVLQAVKDGFLPFKAELVKEITESDIQKLLQIPIRRISLFDINQNKNQVTTINKRLKEIARLLKDLRSYAIHSLEGIITKINSLYTQEELRRHTKIARFTSTDIKEVATRDTALRYDSKTGNLGTLVWTGQELLRVSPYDRILFIRKTGNYTVTQVCDKIFVGQGMWYCDFYDKEMLKEILFTVIYQDPNTHYAFIKRTHIAPCITGRDYFIAPQGMTVLHIDTRKEFSFTLHYLAKPRLKILQEDFSSKDYEEKGIKSQGTRISTKEVESLEVK